MKSMESLLAAVIAPPAPAGSRPSRRILRRACGDVPCRLSPSPLLHRIYAARGLADVAHLDLSTERLLPVASLPGTGEAAELLSRELGLPVFKLEQWRQKAEAALEGALKERESDPAEGQLAAAMQRIGELSMENELLRAKITRLEHEVPFHRARSRR